MSSPVLVVGPIEPPIGGVSRYCRSVADLLRREGSGAVQIDPARPGTNGTGVLARAISWPLRRALGASTLPVLRAVRAQRTGLVLDNRQLLWRDPAGARGLRWLVRVPYALVVHDGAFPEFVGSMDERARGALSRKLETLSGIACMSDAIQDAVLGTSPRARCRRLSPLLEAPRGSGVRLSPELEAFFAIPGPVLCASGALHPQYGIEELLAAFDVLRKGGGRVRLVILLGSFVEESSTRAALAAAQTKHGSGAILTLTDCPDGAQVIARSHAYIRPSRVDSFGMALHEALLSGVPVVATGHPTRPEGVATYAPGDVGSLAGAIGEALLPAARTAALARAPRLRAVVEKNRRDTLDVLAAFAGEAAR